MSTKYSKKEAFDIDVLESTDQVDLVVYNDEVNTFDWVIQSLVEVCSHTAQQAEQLSLIIHFKGKSTVRVGARPELVPLKNQLQDRGLSVDIVG